MISLPQARLPALILGCAIVLAYALSAAVPTRYLATARVLLPGSAVVKIEQLAGDPQLAARSASEQLAAYVNRKAEVLDPVVVRPQRADLALNLAIGAAAGLGLGVGVWFVRERRRRPIRTERDLIDALGPSLLAARPVRPETMRTLAVQLLEHWFSREGALLAIVGAPGERSSRFAAQLAVAFAELGHKTLVIDGNLRSPALHRAFRLANSHGLADFLQDKRVSLACAGQNLAVLVAGAALQAPLELLSRPRLSALLAEARKHFRVVLIDTPAAAGAPDFEIFAALAGGALVVTRRASTDAAALKRLRAALKRCAARLVSTAVCED